MLRDVVQVCSLPIAGERNAHPPCPTDVMPVSRISPFSIGWVQKIIMIDVKAQSFTDTFSARQPFPTACLRKKKEKEKNKKIKPQPLTRICLGSLAKKKNHRSFRAVLSD